MHEDLSRVPLACRPAQSQHARKRGRAAGTFEAVAASLSFSDSSAVGGLGNMRSDNYRPIQSVFEKKEEKEKKRKRADMAKKQL